MNKFPWWGHLIHLAAISLMLTALYIDWVAGSCMFIAALANVTLAKCKRND
jgi:hypothetical protein